MVPDITKLFHWKYSSEFQTRYVCETWMPPQRPSSENCDLDIRPWQITLKLVPTERSCHKVTHVKYEGRNSYQSKDMANVSFCGQTMRQTNEKNCMYTGVIEFRQRKRFGPYGMLRAITSSLLILYFVYFQLNFKKQICFYLWNTLSYLQKHPCKRKGETAPSAK